MSYISHWFLSLRDCHALQLRDSYALHKAVYGLFPYVREQEHADTGRILYVDKGMHEGQRHMLILSNRPPRPALHGALHSRELPGEFFDAELYRFETVINCVRRQGNHAIPITEKQEILDWFQKRSSRWGFRAFAQSMEVRTDWACIEKRGRTLTLTRPTLRGVLHVVDRDLFRKSVCSGIGRGRAFGCGLLQVAPFFRKKTDWSVGDTMSRDSRA